MSNETKKPLSPLLQELNDIIAKLPAMAQSFGGLKDILRYVAKLVRKIEALEDQVNTLKHPKTEP